LTIRRHNCGSARTRQGEITLGTRTRCPIFIAGLVGVVVLAFMMQLTI
jgi:hypothetical protein